MPALGIPRRYILASGGFDHTANLKDAIWAFDVLKYTDPSLHLVLLGDGPLRVELQRFSWSLAFDDHRVRFAGWQPDVSAYLRSAAVVWVTHLNGGTKFALEAMAAGVPVIAMRTPDTEAVIEHGVNGLLTPFADRVGLAAVTRKVLNDAEQAERLGCAARVASANCSAGALGAAVRAEYDRLTR